MVTTLVGMGGLGRTGGVGSSFRAGVFNVHDSSLTMIRAMMRMSIVDSTRERGGPWETKAGKVTITETVNIQTDCASDVERL